MAGVSLAPLAPYGIDFIDENDAGGVSAGLFKQFAHGLGTAPLPFGHKGGRLGGDKGRLGLARHGPGEQGLACSGRAVEKDSLGRPQTS